MTDLELIKKYVPINKQEDAIKKINSGYPVQYIIGNVDFYGCIINVNENVLIPRFETEYLVDKTIKYLNKLGISKPEVLEIGTGSGCISIALKKNIDCNIKAIDISENAIKLAIKNANLNNVDIEYEVKDIHNFISNKKYDLIISNPPYVPFGSEVDEKVKYEPQNAIYAEDNGLYYYDIILNKIKNNLCDNYLIAFEIGNKQGNSIKDLVNKYFPKSNVIIEKDYNEYERYVFISNKIII